MKKVTKIMLPIIMAVGLSTSACSFGDFNFLDFLSGDVSEEELYQQAYELYQQYGGKDSMEDWKASIHGEFGTEIENVGIDAEGNLVITYTNGNALYAGKVREVEEETYSQSSSLKSYISILEKRDIASLDIQNLGWTGFNPNQTVYQDERVTGNFNIYSQEYYFSFNDGSDYFSRQNGNYYAKYGEESAFAPVEEVDEQIYCCLDEVVSSFFTSIRSTPVEDALCYFLDCVSFAGESFLEVYEQYHTQINPVLELLGFKVFVDDGKLVSLIPGAITWFNKGLLRLAESKGALTMDGTELRVDMLKIFKSLRDDIITAFESITNANSYYDIFNSALLKSFIEPFFYDLSASSLYLILPNVLDLIAKNSSGKIDAKSLQLYSALKKVFSISPKSGESGYSYILRMLASDRMDAVESLIYGDKAATELFDLNKPINWGVANKALYDILNEFETQISYDDNYMYLGVNGYRISNPKIIYTFEDNLSGIKCMKIEGQSDNLSNPAGVDYAKIDAKIYFSPNEANLPLIVQ